MASRASTAWVGFAVLGAALAIFGLVALSLVGQSPPATPSAAQENERFPNTWPEPPPADVSRLLDGLGPGSPLVGSWRVRGVSPVADRRIVVDVDRGNDVGFRVWLMLPETDQRLPPLRTERYVLYTAQPRPTAQAVSDEMFSEVLGALAVRIRKTEMSVPVPSGL